MISLKKIPSDESYDIDGSVLRSIIHFQFDAGFYDLNSSCVILPTTITSTETAGADGVHNVSMKYRPQVFIKNDRMSSDRGGILEDNTHNNFRNVNMEKFTRSTAQNESDTYFDGVNYVDEFSNNYSSFRNLLKTGAVASTSNTPELRVPLRELFSIASMPQYPPNMGRTTVRLEFQSGSGMLVENRRYTDHAGSPLSCDNVAATGGAAADVVAVVLAGTFPTDKDLPSWVGQKLNIQFTDGANPAATVDVVITEVARNAASNKATITFTPRIVNTAALVSAITIIEVAAASLAYKIQIPKLLLYQISPSAGQRASAVKKLSNANIPLRQWSLEMDNLTDTTEYNRQFYLEPNCSNAVMFFQPPQVGGNDQMDSVSANLGSYRCSLGQVDLTNTDVIVKTPLEKDRQMWTVLNSGLPLKNLRNPPDSVLNPVPAVPDQQQYSVQLKKSAGGNISACNVHLYKQLNRVLKISKGQVAVN